MFRFLLKFIFITNLLTNIEVEMAFSSNAHVRRAHSLQNKPGIKLHMKSQPASSASSSSNIHGFNEVQLRPLIDETSYNRLPLQFDLQEATSGSHTGMQLNPARDGVYARIRKILRKHSLPAAVGFTFGVATGIGGVNYVGKMSNNSKHSSKIENYESSTLKIVSSTMETDIEDDIMNKI